MLSVEMIIAGKLDEEWEPWLAGIGITYSEDGETIISGVMSDQSALYGLISKIRDLGLTLKSVNTKEIDQVD